MVRHRHGRRTPEGGRGIRARAGGVRELSDAELERIRAAYRERDATEDTPYRWDNSGYVAYMQSVERALLNAFSDAGVRIQGARVLDVGCGSGYFLHRLREYGAGDCQGIDLMEDRIAAGRERYPGIGLHIGSATELPFDDGEFDLVTQFTCLSSIVNPDVRLAAAREMKRVARGWVLSFDMRGMLPRRLRRKGPTPIVPLDERELRHLFGEPALLRRVALAFELAEVSGRNDLLGAVLGALPPLRSHLLGLWDRRGSAKVAKERARARTPASESVSAGRCSRE